MNRRRLITPVAALVAVAAGGLGLDALRDATQSVHEVREPGSTIELVVRAEAKGNESVQTLDEMVEAIVETCRLEVRSDVVQPLRDEGGGRYVTRLQPSMDPTNRRQFRGCLEDWTVDHLKVEVVRLVELDPR